MRIKHFLYGATLLPSLALAQVANISRTDGSISGLNLSTGMQNAVSQSYVQNDGKTFIVVKGGANAVTASAITQQTSGWFNGFGLISMGNQDVAIPSASLVIMGPYPMSRWNNVNGSVQISFTSVTGVSVTAIRDPQ
ncbi:hypothetical protein QWJ07_04000 [Frankia sp. RB7]|nr:hypothetical protein [Frankia sp. RB7]